MSRCLCVWSSICSCIASLTKSEGKNLCETLPDSVSVADYDDDSDENYNSFSFLLIFFLFIALIILIGLFKALLGLCIHAVGKWKYNYVQPSKPYENSSKVRRFIINTIFCCVLPCVAMCKCFTSKHPKRLSPDKSSTWTRSIIEQEYSSEDECELTKLLEASEGIALSHSHEALKSTTIGTSRTSSIFGPYSQEDEEKDTSFVLSALTESRESLKMLVSKSKQPLVFFVFFFSLKYLLFFLII